MKKLIILLTLCVTSLGAFAQADSLARTMNGFYKWNGEQFYRDTLWADTSMFDVSTGNLQLSLDTVGSGASGYYKIITSAGGVGSLKGRGNPLQYPYLVSNDSIASSAAIAIDTVTGIPDIPAIASPREDGRIRLYDNDSVRFSIDTLAIKFNEQRPTDFYIFNTSDTAVTVDVSAKRVGINSSVGDLNAALTITASGSDNMFKFIEPTLSTGANTPTINTAPITGKIRWLPVTISQSGTSVTAYLPILTP